MVAPHPDDELLGCGGLLLRRITEGAHVCWVIVTSVSTEAGWDLEQVLRRQSSIEHVTKGLGIQSKDVVQLGFPTAQLDQIPRAELVQTMSEVFRDFAPSEVLTPHSGDVHTDHRVTAEVVDACTKWFRYPSVDRVLAYETLSETGFGLSAGRPFKPNVYVDVSPWLERKIELLRLYPSEMGDYPFPRSETAVRALAEVRGASSGFKSAEAFELLLERQCIAAI